MIDRVIDLSEEGAKLSVRLEQLIIQRGEKPPISVPLEEAGVVVAAHREVVFTQSALAGLASKGAMVVVCDEKFMPAGMLMPLTGHHLQAERFAQQAQASAPARKRAWQQVIQCKILRQADALRLYRTDAAGLERMAENVRSGDPDNIEGQAARRYWQALFPGQEFRRDPDCPDQNRLLNYGYAVLRACTARAICAAGLHPSLGIHHHNRYDTFCLADDLMEPYRPMVDVAVVDIVNEKGREVELDRTTKGALIQAVLGRVLMENEMRTLFEALVHTAVSLTRVFMGTGRKLVLPERLWDVATE